MIKPIEIAIAGGLLNLKDERVLIVERNKVKYHPTFPHVKQVQIWRYIREDEEFNYRVKGVWSGSFRDLVLDPELGFIDKLVGEGDCIHRPDGDKCKDYRVEDWCANCEPKNAYYHREQLANMTLPYMKKYITTLANDQREG